MWPSGGASVQRMPPTSNVEVSLASAASFLAVPSAWDSGWAMYRVDGVRASERRRGARHLTAPRRTLGQTCDAERRAGELHDEVLRRVLQVADEDLTRLEALALQDDSGGRCA